MSATVTKMIRLPAALHGRLRSRAVAEKKDYAKVASEAMERGLAEEGLDMSVALAGFIGMGRGTGRSQAERMKSYGRPRTR